MHFMLASAQFGTKCALDVSGAFPRKLFLIFQINKTIFKFNLYSPNSTSHSLSSPILCRISTPLYKCVCAHVLVYL